MTACGFTLPMLIQRAAPLFTTNFRDAILYTTEWSVVVLKINLMYHCPSPCNSSLIRAVRQIISRNAPVFLSILTTCETSDPWKVVPKHFSIVDGDTVFTVKL